MTLYQFRALSIDEQANAVWEGEFFLFRCEGNHVVMLYKVHDFYVEVFYDSETNTIEKLNPFSSPKWLRLYFHLSHN